MLPPAVFVPDVAEHEAAQWPYEEGTPEHDKGLEQRRGAIRLGEEAGADLRCKLKGIRAQNSGSGSVKRRGRVALG